jgi:hypothetical protein
MLQICREAIPFAIWWTLSLHCDRNGPATTTVSTDTSGITSRQSGSKGDALCWPLIDRDP